MKKILTLLIAVGAFVTLQAQSREEARRVILGDRKDNGSYGGRNDRDVVLGRNESGRYPGGYSSDRQYQVDQINREYDNKIESIRNNRYLSSDEKERTIRQLERDRQKRIANLNRQYNDRSDRDRRYDNNDRYDRSRGDNGKHKGWYKKEKNKNWKKGKRERDWG
jgi:hypothetical protein